MEVYSKTTRFALACNNSDQIIGVFVCQCVCYSVPEVSNVCKSILCNYGYLLGAGLRNKKVCRKFFKNPLVLISLCNNSNQIGVFICQCVC